MILDLKIDVLREHCDNYNSNNLDAYGDDAEQLSIREYAEREAENDPGFYRWIFDDSEIGDFGLNLTEAQRKEYAEFIENL